MSSTIGRKLFCGWLFLISFCTAFGGSSSPRQDNRLDADWRTTMGDIAGAESPNFNDSTISQDACFSLALFGARVIVKPRVAVFTKCIINIREAVQLVFLAAALFASNCRTASAGVLERWHWRYPEPQGNRLSSVAYGSGRFVAVGVGGTIVTSTNGTNWVDKSLPINLNIRSVAYGNNRFVAVGIGGSLTSTNGLDWNFTSNAPPNQYQGVTFGADLFVAVGSGTVRTSSDGVSWTSRASSLSLLESVAYGNGMFIAVGYGGAVVTSSNGTNWLTRTSVGSDLVGIAYANNVFVAIPSYNNNVYTTADGTSWASRYFGGTTISLYSVTYGANGFVVMGDQMTVTSTDGTNWIRNNNLNSLEFDGVIYANGIYAAAGERGAVQTSSDGVNWTSQTGLHFDLNGVAYGSGRFVAVGALGTILSSSNGVSWQPVNSGTSNYFFNVGYCNSNFIAVGIRNSSAVNILSSSNSVNWLGCVGGENNWLYGVSYGNGVYVAVGSGGAVLTSTNILNWVSGASGITAGLKGVAFGGGRFTAIGDGGTIVTSEDGVLWTPRNSGVSGYLNGIVFANGLFVAVGGDYGLISTIVTSTNGIDWQTQSSPTSYTLNDVSYGNGVFTAMIASSIPAIFFSTDGAVWKTASADIADWLGFRMAYGSGTFVVAGSKCGIVQSDSTAPAELSLARLQDGSGVVLSVAGEVGRNYRLQYRSYLGDENWSDLLSFTNNRPVVTLTNFSSDQQRFYRVTSP